MKEGSTSPPELLTEAELISIMDANGIGKHEGTSIVKNLYAIIVYSIPNNLHDNMLILNIDAFIRH
jgi:hypothetical protein